MPRDFVHRPRHRCSEGLGRGCRGGHLCSGDGTFERCEGAVAGGNATGRDRPHATRKPRPMRCPIKAVWAESAAPVEHFIWAVPFARCGGKTIMTRRPGCLVHRRGAPHSSSSARVGEAATPNYPITPQQRATAQRAAETGVPLSEIKPDAPDVYTVKPRDTLWGISGLYLKSPWRWPELWGMNLDQVRNPHLIFPGQMLFLDKSNGRARLRMGTPITPQDARLSPRIRSTDIALGGIASIPFHLIEPS